MKKITRILFALSLITVGTLFSPKKSSAQDVDVQIFYDQLSPYGTWVSDPNYGYVWVPQVGPDFTPYGTNGYWEWSDDGWLWVSDYPWGWAPFHYGRWNYDNNYGWMWVPGRTWGPAWVEWRSCPGYYGWCPLGPGIGVNSYASYRPAASRWVFVQDKYINSPRVSQYYERRENNANIINRTTVIDNRQVDNSRHATYFAGPRREDVQKVTGTEIKPVAIRDNPKPGQTAGNGEVSIYRPTVQKTAANATRKPAPQKVAAVSDLKPIPGGHAQAKSQPAKSAAAPTKTTSHPAAPKASTFQQPQKQQQHTKSQVNNTQPQKQVQHNSTPRQQAPQAAPKQQPAQQAPKQQPAQRQNSAPRPAQQPRAQPAPRPQPAPQARPAEQPHQEQPKQEQPKQEEPNPR